MTSSTWCNGWLLLCLAGTVGCQEETLSSLCEAGAECFAPSLRPIPMPSSCPLETGERPRVVSLSSDSLLMMALLSDGSVLCWGQDYYASCGYSYWLDYPLFARGPECLVTAEVGASMSAGLSFDGRVVVWGSERANEAGDGPAPGPAFGEATFVELPAVPIKSVSPGPPMVALTENGDVHLWGNVSLGTYSPSGFLEFVEIDRPWEYPVPAPIDMAGESRCLLASSREVYCFGAKSSPMLGPNPRDWHLGPTRIDLDDVREIAQSNWHACALNGSGEVWCWGENLFGAMGRPWPEVELHPEPLIVEGIPRAKRIFAGNAASCALAEQDGVAWCWTVNETFANGGSIPPTPWREDLRFVDIGLGNEHACGLVDDGRVYCSKMHGGCPPNGHPLDCFIDIDGAIDARAAGYESGVVYEDGS